MSLRMLRTISVTAIFLALFVTSAFAQTAPDGLNGYFNEDTGEIQFFFTHDSGGDELIYDEGENSSGYQWVGAIMGTHMSPDGPCQVLRLKYWVFVNDPEEGDPDPYFYATLHDWDTDNDLPMEDTLYIHETLALNASEWIEVDISDQDINVDGDFHVGFGSRNEDTYIIYSPDDNGRSYDFDGDSWSSWNEGYYIRAIVQYPDGQIAEIDASGEVTGSNAVSNLPTMSLPAGKHSATSQFNAENFTYIEGISPNANELDELDAFTLFNYYRDDELINSIRQTVWRDTLPEYGSYDLDVTADYDPEGESDPTSITITWEPPLVIPTDLSADLDDATGIVTLTWSHPELDDFVEFGILRRGSGDWQEIAQTIDGFYIDQLPEPGPYLYAVLARYDEGDSEPCDYVVVNWVGDAVENKTEGIPNEWAVSKAYPNPFNPSVSVTVAVPEAGNLTVAVYDLMGRQVAELHRGAIQPGHHSLTWDSHGPSGIYLLKATNMSGWSTVRKLVKMK